MGRTMRVIGILLLCMWSAPAWADVVYLSPIVGDGSEGSPFRPHHNPGAWYDCSPLKTQYLCAGPSLPNAPGVILLPTEKSAQLSPDSMISLRLSRKATLNKAIWTVVDADKLNVRPHQGRQRIRVHGMELAERSAPLRAYIPIIVDGVMHFAKAFSTYIVSPTVAWAATVTETFNCANATGSLTCDQTWTNITGTLWDIASNQASKTVTGAARARAGTPADTDDHIVTVTLANLATTGGGFGRCGVLGRKDNTGTATHYSFHANSNSGTQQHETARFNSATFTSLATVNTAPSNGTVLGLVMDGNDISGTINGVVVVGPTTDGSPITGNTYGGVYSGTSVSTFSCQLDNWQIADIVPPASYLPFQRRTP